MLSKPLLRSGSYLIRPILLEDSTSFAFFAAAKEAISFLMISWQLLEDLRLLMVLAGNAIDIILLGGFTVFKVMSYMIVESRYVFLF